MNVKRVLIMEDDLETSADLLRLLGILESKLGVNISATVLSEYWQVEDYLMQSLREKFDIVLLDRDCKMGGSFHNLNFKKFARARLIGISSVPKYNLELLGKRVYAVVDKDYERLDVFISKVSRLIEEIIATT